MRRRRRPSRSFSSHLPRACAAAVAPLLLAACASARPPGDSLDANAAEVSLCVPPTVDTTTLRRVDRGSFSVGVPRPFTISGRGSDTDGIQFLAGSGRIVLLEGNYPMLFNDGSTETLLDATCTAMIDGRPVEIVAIHYHVPSAPLHGPDPLGGAHFVVGARWNGVLGGRDVAMWIDTRSPASSRRLRAMFWTVRFARDTARADGGQ